jgi:Leucine-rich repeat (LRR) protein
MTERKRQRDMKSLLGWWQLAVGKRASKQFVGASLVCSLFYCGLTALAGQPSAFSSSASASHSLPSSSSSSSSSSSKAPGIRTSAQGSPYFEITFPGNQDYGHIFALPADFSYERSAARPLTRLLAIARGKVRLPRKWQLMFAPNDSISENAEVFAQLPDDAFVSLDLEKLSLGDKQIDKILHMKSLLCLELEGCEISDAGLAKLTALPNLIKISAYGTEITGTTIKNLVSLKHLRRLRLGCNRLDLSCIDDIARLKNIVWLNLDRVKLSDKDLLKISHMQQLHTLEVPHNPKVTSVGLGYLKKMPNLRILDLRDCKITAADLIGLKSTKIESVSVSPESFNKADMAAIKAALKGREFVSYSREEAMPPELFAPLK